MPRTSRNRQEKVYEDSYIDVESDEGEIETKSHSPEAISIRSSQRSSDVISAAAAPRRRSVESSEDISSRSKAHDNFEHSFVYDHDVTCKWEYSSIPAPSSKEFSNWESLSDEAQKQCVKAVTRLFLTKGARGETVDRESVSAVLGNLDSTYRKLKNMVIFLAQKALYENFGYIVTPEKAVIGNVDGKKDTFYLSNALQNDALLKILADGDMKANAYRGFVFVVCQIIFASPGRVIDGDSLLRQLRTIDNRFPETMSKKKSSSQYVSHAIPELGDDAFGLINRMKKEGYIIVEKDETNVDDPGKMRYKLGGRFHNDIGKIQLLKAHFHAKGESVPEFLVKLIEEEDSGYIAEMMDELGIPMSQTNAQAETQAEPERNIESNRHTRSTREATSSSSSSSQPVSKRVKMM